MTSRRIYVSVVSRIQYMVPSQDPGTICGKQNLAHVEGYLHWLGTHFKKLASGMSV